MKKVWFITGAGSGLGAGITAVALRAGDHVVATWGEGREVPPFGTPSGSGSGEGLFDRPHILRPDLRDLLA